MPASGGQKADKKRAFGGQKAGIWRAFGGHLSVRCYWRMRETFWTGDRAPEIIAIVGSLLRGDIYIRRMGWEALALCTLCRIPEITRVTRLGRVPYRDQSNNFLARVQKRADLGRDLHQVLAPDDPAAIDLRHFAQAFLTDAWRVHLRCEMGCD